MCIEPSPQAEQGWNQGRSDEGPVESKCTVGRRPGRRADAFTGWSARRRRLLVLLLLSTSHRTPSRQQPRTPPCIRRQAMSSGRHRYSSSDPDSAFTLAGSAVGGLGRSLGRSASSRVSWARLSRWAPLLAVFLCGYLSCWLSYGRLRAEGFSSFGVLTVVAAACRPPSLAVPGFAPTPPAPALVFPETFRETLLNPSNPWTRPGVIRNRPTVPIKFPWGDPDPELYRRVRWEPAPSDGIHPDYGQGGAESLMEQLADSIKAGVQPEGWEWAVNKTILGVGDSLMRNNVMFFTDHVSHGKVRLLRSPRPAPRVLAVPSDCYPLVQFQRRLLPLQSPDGTDWQHGQGMGVVDVPGLGLKVGQWFHQGMVSLSPPSAPIANPT
jgi:hypothetical protein